MKIVNVSCIVFKERGEKIYVDKMLAMEISQNGTLPILWCRDGLFCVIPKEVVNNAMDNCEMYQQTDLRVTPPITFFTWDQGIPISNQAGRALLGE